jgi:UDP-N-acetylglucosamine--N-acetylmuramyl-(pentapeptide) pyrophosphoryl-undecaprenol N-acetylglucosamine transferase
MTEPGANTPFVAIACGGTGGHLFPGLAVAERLAREGCAVAVLISPKEVDQQAVKSVRGMEVFTLPAVAWQRGSRFAFPFGFCRSWWASWKIFKSRRPHAVLAMGGFTSAPPVLAAKCFGARTFLHESNTIPGRANRFLARFVDEAFVGFPTTAARLRARKVTHTGTPVRPQFRPRDAATCRAALGLDPGRPTILVMGGSQGAGGINEIVLSTLPLLADRAWRWQWLHLTGTADFEKVVQAYTARKIKAVVRPFLREMELALGAATVAVSRAGASSLAELAAMRLPSVLVPFPAAAGNHQFHNARAFEMAGAARLLEQKHATPGRLMAWLRKLVDDETARGAMRTALAQWHTPQAAERIAEIMLATITRWSKTAKAGAIDSENSTGFADEPAGPSSSIGT